MAEPASNGVGYGHLGTLKYQKGSLKWKTGRAPGRCSFLTASHSSADTYVPASLSGEFWSANRSNSADRASAIRKLVRANPEFQPAISCIKDLTRTAAIDAEELLTNDYCIGDLVDIGTARCEKPVPNVDAHCKVLAVPAGLNGDSVKFLELGSSAHGWSDGNGRGHGSPYLETFHLSNLEASLWKGNGERIEQICANSLSPEGVDLFALRTAREITVLSLKFSRSAIKGRPLKTDFQSIPANISPNLVCSIKDEASDSSFIDMSINPFDKTQVVTVDQTFQWSVWQLLEDKSGSARRLCGGRLNFQPDQKAQSTIEAEERPWCKILWCIDASTLILCRRRSIHILHMDRKSPSLSLQDSPFLSGDAQITDIRINPTQLDELIITTTSHVWVYRLHIIDDSKPSAQAPQALQILAFWEHHRDLDDTSLRTQLLVENTGVLVLLHSRRSRLVTQYQLERMEDADRAYVLALEPAAFKSPDDYLENFRSNIELHNQSLNYLVLPLSFRTTVTNVGHNPLGAQTGVRYYSNGVRFYQVLNLKQDLSLSGSIYYRQSVGTEAFGPNDSTFNFNIEPPNWKHSSKRSTASMKVHQSKEDFIVDDGDASLSGIDDVKSPFRPNHQGGIGKQKLANEIFTVPNELIYNKITTDWNGVSDLVTVFPTILPTMKHLERSQAWHWRTLLSLIDSRFAAREIDEVSDILRRFVEAPPISELAEIEKLQVSQLGTAATLGIDIPQTTNITISALYRQMVEQWIGSLPRHVPGRTRLAKEKAIRLIACSIGLSAFVIRLQKEEFSNEEELLDAGQETPAARLRAYTTVQKLPEPPKQSVSRILAHWALDEDPNKYDHAAKTAEIADRPNIEGSALTEEARKTLWRRMERRRRRNEELMASKRRRLDLAGNESQPTEEQRPWMSSQPQPSREQGSSSQGNSQSQRQDVPAASQVVPGKYGGKPVLAIRKPPRKKGF